MYDFYLGEIKLPVAPSKVTIGIGSSNKTISIAEGKEINILKSPRLKTISFKALIPNSSYPFANYSNNEYQSSDYYKDAIESLKNENEIIAFVITRTKGTKVFNYTGIYAVIEELTFTESAENGYDLAIDIKLREYEAYGAKFYSSETTVTSVNNTQTAKNTQYTVKSGDSLWKIAKSIYGDGSKWQDIYNANKNVISNPDKLYTGTTIILP
ncbi:MAG: LysM peptidoglycan-binding domain-containing protein [Clostridia bacterium]|nr:LysM peptidoglycan-binding domain-containing protein [Clostridia bacterium]